MDKNETPDFKERETEFTYEDVEPAGEPVVLERLLSKIEDAIKRHAVLKPEAAKALAAWVVHTYVFQEREAVAYVAIQSPEKRCGKTTLLSVLAAMASKALVASNITVGALFRAIDQAGPTLLIDEADTYLGRNSPMRGILNCGNTRRTAYVLRLAHKSIRQQEEQEFRDGSTPSNVVRFSCWCPKVIAMIGTVPETLADRSIVVNMERKLTSEKCAPIAELNALEIKRQCTRWSSDHAQEVRHWPRITLQEVNDRASDTFEPLLVLAQMAGTDCYEQMLQAAKKLCAHENTEPEAASLLLDIMALFITSQQKRIFSQKLAQALKGNSGWVTFDVESRHAVSELSIATTLRKYHIRPTTVRIGPDVGKGYKWEDFITALEHYVPRTEIQRKVAELKEMNALALEADEERQRLRKKQEQATQKVSKAAEKAVGKDAALSFQLTLLKVQQEQRRQEEEEAMSKESVTEEALAIGAAPEPQGVTKCNGV